MKFGRLTRYYANKHKQYNRLDRYRRKNKMPILIQMEIRESRKADYQHSVSPPMKSHRCIKSARTLSKIKQGEK